VRRHVPGRSRDLVAGLSGLPGGSPEREPAVAALDPLLSLRRTNRRQFADDQVPADLLATLDEAAGCEGARTFAVTEHSHRLAVASLSQRAEAIEQADPAYRAELKAWVTDDQQRGDGVPVSTLPRTGGQAGEKPHAGEVPLRRFADPGDAGLPDGTWSSPEQSLLLLGTDTDDPRAWLRTGEALERVWLEVTRAGYAMSLFTQVIEVPGTRDALCSELGLTMYPHVLLRIGRAPATPASRRRKLVEVLRHAPRVEGSVK
jgi:Nitroreductase family